MGVPGGHDDGLPCVEQVIRPVNGDPAHAVEAGYKSIAAGFMGTDFFSLCKGEQGNKTIEISVREGSYTAVRDCYRIYFEVTIR